MNFVWDENKNSANIRKHKLSFQDAVLIFRGPILTRLDTRQDYDEVREISLVCIEGLKEVMVVHMPRQDRIRIISARKATKRERKIYHEYLRRTT